WYQWFVPAPMRIIPRPLVSIAFCAHSRAKRVICSSGTPVIALMQDQVAALTQMGVAAAAVNSAIPPHEARETERRLRAGELDLVYVAPERLLTEPFLYQLDHARVALFAIDEAHCVSQWGHDFRPEYRGLAVLAERFPGVPRLALTATADGPTRDDILAHLDLQAGRVFASGFDRPNIQYRVAPKENPKVQIKRLLDRHHGAAGIVYCGTRARVDDWARWLNDQGVPALPYHAGLDAETRAANQRRFLREDGVVMVATVAFGMGIDKPDVRFVAHLDLPKSLEAYYQETGRAGRDGLPAEAWMVWGVQDVGRLRQFIIASEAAEEQKRVERSKLDALLGYCETAGCRRQVLLSYFGDHCEPCGNCDTCLAPPETFDGTQAVQKALSAVYRTGQMFGQGHIVDVLTGADTERIRKFAHDRLPTYGVGGEFSKTEWRGILRQIIALGLLEVDVAGHGGLHLGPDCRPVLRGERTIELRRPPQGRAAATARRGSSSDGLLEDPADRALFERLRALRMDLAKAQGVPPYVVFGDRTLVEMARERPRDLNDLAGLYGVGAAKLDRYGADFLAVIATEGEAP
ncbi:MAG: DNA helicase RecQ, partial [Rhodobacterales bacterium]|nr:DNA helicase RecQ [Rhodobacterales bacterium]